MEKEYDMNKSFPKPNKSSLMNPAQAANDPDLVATVQKLQPWRRCNVSGNVSHVRAGDSPPSSGYAQPSPYATLLAKIKEVEVYTHTVLQQYPKIGRYVLCADIRAALVNIQRLSIVAWKRHPYKRFL